jgi:hypothetical protein
MVPLDFHYTPTCSAPNCMRAAIYKIGASWSAGTSWELKNYGLACEEHKGSQLARAQLHREGLVLADGEAIGQVALFELRTNARDTELNRLADHGG